MYRNERVNRRAASEPSQRDMPFSMDKHYQGEKKAKNDPVGTQSYASNAYGQDKSVNWIDRS